MVGKNFFPSRTAQNGLNFITPDDEHALSIKEQPEVIINMFKLIYLYLGESYDTQTNQTLIAHLINNIQPKYNVDNLSNLFVYFRKPFS
jgi:hypothetical protein